MVAAIAETEYGKVRGKLASDYKGGRYYSFQGIPYAKPPLGELRFKAPEPPETWKGIRDATTEAGGSLSKNFLFEDIIVGSEDCLYLNVYTPTLPNYMTTNLKPVMFWIHGGGFKMGSSKTEIYGPEYLITEDVVLVTINYRLGILGFLSIDDPKLDVPGNAGLKDVVMALKWVQKNIENFGGNPNNVTIFGESAGSVIVHGMILSPMGKGLFHRAILQSGCLLNPWAYGDKIIHKVARILGCETSDEAAMLQFLRTVSAEKIMMAQEQIYDPFRCDQKRPFGVVVEKNAMEPMFFSEHPLKIMKSGNYNKVPIIIGYMSNEGIISVITLLKLYDEIRDNKNFEDKIPYLLKVPRGTELSLNIANKIKKAYYGTSKPSPQNYEAFENLETDVMFFRGIYESIQSHLKTLNHPIYFYTFTADTSLNIVKSLSRCERPGACHADDIAYLFKTQLLPEIPKNSLEELIVKRIVKLWTNFAKHGDPNSKEADKLIPVTWEPVEEGTYKCLEIGSSLRFGTNPDLDRMKVWDEISSILLNAKL